PDVKWNQSEILRLPPSENRFTLISEASDDNGITKAVLKYRRKGDIQWMPLETREINNLRQCTLNWTPDCSKLTSDEEWEFEAVFHDALTENSSPVLRVIWLSELEMRFMLLQNLCSLIRSIRISVTTYLLEGRGTYTKIQWIDLLDEMSRFDSWNSEIKKSGLSPPRLFQAAKTISSIRNLFQSLERSPSKEEMKRTEGELIHAWSDFQTLALSLQSLIVQKEFQNLKKKLLRSKESGCSVSDLLQAAKKGVHLQKILYEQKDYFLNNGEIRMQQHMEPCFQFMDKLSFSSFFPLFLQKIKEGKKTESVSMIGPFLEKWEKEGKILAGFGMKKKSGSLDRDPLLKGVIKKLKTIRGILNRMELSRTVPDEEFKWMKEALKSSLFLCIDELNAIQVQTASTGLHGLTFLNSAGYDLDEMESWYLIGSSLKAESKLKKAIGNITGCLYALEKQIAVSLNRNETAKESKDFKQAQIFIRIIRPIGDLVAPSQGTVEIKALVKSPEGISQVWIHAEPAESHQEEKKIFSSLVEDHPDLPESVSVTARLPISDLKLSVQQTIRVYLSALDSNQNSANSDPFFIRVKKIGDTINLNHYFRFKAMASEVLSLLVESEKDVLRLLEQSEYALIQGKPIQKESWQEMMTMQDLIQEKFLDFISKTETEAEKCSHFPEKDFITFLNLGRSSSVKEFHDVKHALLQIQTVLDEGDFSKEAAISLFFESRNRLQSIVRDLEEMRKFFGLSMNDAVQNNKTAKKWVQAKTFWKKWVQQTKQDMKDGRFGKELVPEMKKRSGDCLSYLKSLELDITPIQEKMTSFLNQLDEPKKADLLEYFSFFAREMERMMGRNLETVLSQTFTDAIIELAENKGDVPSSLQRAENSLAGLSSLGNLSSDKQLALEMLKFSGKQGPIKDVRSITDLLKQSFPVLDERNLGIWERISLNEHKLQLLSPALSDLESVQDFNMKDIQFLEKISSLIDIFSNQIEELKKQAEMNSRPEEKEKQLAQIHILLEKLSGLDRKRKNIEEMIRADAWQFEEDHRIEVEKQVKDLIRFDKEKTGPKELIPRVKEKASLLKEIMKTFLDSRNRDEAMKTAEGPVQSALELFYLFHQLDEKSFERKVPFMTDFLKSILLYKLSVEKQHCRAQDNFLKRIRENARMIDQVCSEFLNELANTAYVEFRRRGEKDLTEKISALGQNIHDARKLLATLQAKMNRTIEDEKEMDRLQKYLVEAKSMLNDLEKERDTVMNLKGITISIVPQEQGKTTLLTKLGLDELEEKAGEMAHLVNEEEEKLDQKILRNLSEELEEMESQREKDGEEREEKLRRIAQTASLMDVPLKGTTAAELKQSLENAVIDGMKQQETTSVAQVLKSLKDAAEFVESGEKETEGGYGKSQKEARFRYLQQFQSQKQQLERIQDFMGEANLLSSHFKSKSDELLSKLDHQMEELRQSMTGEEWLIKQREAREIIQQVTLEFNKETQIRLEGRKPITLDEKKIQRSFPLFIQKDIPGYGLLIRKYLEAVATK
ncbi:MAG: hypothetical protein JW774_07975, partial [Candidatus Aureabacteria bacterium]|nr:hypothetical protein [Candidatus Auribacterota bacterium]